jgi:hypothetical protein
MCACGDGFAWAQLTLSAMNGCTKPPMRLFAEGRTADTDVLVNSQHDRSAARILRSGTLAFELDKLLENYI